jgi:hypothetical protein
MRKTRNLCKKKFSFMNSARIHCSIAIFFLILRQFVQHKAPYNFLFPHNYFHTIDFTIQDYEVTPTTSKRDRVSLFITPEKFQGVYWGQVS